MDVVLHRRTFADDTIGTVPFRCGPSEKDHAPVPSALKLPTEYSATTVPPTDGALAGLRRATRERHARIDRLMNLRRMRERGHYGRVLLAFHGFLGPWEESVAAALPARWHAWLRRRSRRHFLREDLAALSLPTSPAAAANVPPLAGNAAAWGSLYVIEGSALGGQVITRALASAGLLPRHGAAYFHGWGGDTPALWQEFLQQLQEQVATPACIEAACAAACGTFDALTAHLHDHLNERAATA